MILFASSAGAGARWDHADVGQYLIHALADQVRDTLGNAVPPGEIGAFKVLIRNPAALNIASMPASGSANVTHTDLDIGPITNVFDGNFSSLARAIHQSDGNDAEFYRPANQVRHSWQHPSHPAAAGNSTAFTAPVALAPRFYRIELLSF